MARHCTQCGTRLSETDRFCAECGATISAAPAAAPSTPITAPPPPPPPPPAAVAATASRVLIGSITAATVIGGAAVAAWLLLPHGGMPDPPPTPVPSATTVAVAPTPVAPPPPTATAKLGTWQFFSNEDGTQLLYRPAGAPQDGAAPLRLICRAEDEMVAVVSSAVIDDAAEQVARAARPMMVFSSGGQAIRAEGYIVRAPEETALAFETANDGALAQVLGAADLTIAVPSLTVAADPTAFRQFVAACPAATLPPDPDHWGTFTSLDHGYRIAVPRDLLRVGSGDRFGRTWEARAGGASMTVLGQVNALDEPFPAVVRKLVPADLTTVSEIVGADFLSIAGTAGGREVHFTGRVTCGGANVVTLTISYPPTEKGTWAPLVERIERTFNFTTRPTGRPLCP